MPNEYLIREGEESTEMYYLQSGTLAIFKRKGDQEHQIGTIIAGELVGEMSFLDKKSIAFRMVKTPGKIQILLQIEGNLYR